MEGSWVEISPKQLREAYAEGRPTHRFAYDPGNEHYMRTWDSCFDLDFSKKDHAAYTQQLSMGKLADYHECTLAIFRDIRRARWDDPGFRITAADWKIGAETIEEHSINLWGLQQAIQLTIPTVYQVNIPTSATHTPQGLGNLKGSLAFLDHIRLRPFGVLGDQLSENDEIREVRTRPDTNTAIVDPGGL